MSIWRDVNRDSWTFTRRSIVGAGGGIGEYGTSYAINTTEALLNGRIAGDIKLIERYSTGAGLLCRADDQWTWMAFYVAPAVKGAASTVARISVCRSGKLSPVAALSTPIILPNDYAHFSLEFYSGLVRGEIRYADQVYQLTTAAPYIPFPGHVGVVKFYSAEVLMRNLVTEKTEMQFAIDAKDAGTGFDFDVFLCHSSADKELVQLVAREFKQSGIKYWLDSEQLIFGDSITQKIEDGLQRSRYLVPCLSENLSKSGWTRTEYGAILNAELSGPSRRRVIPLKLTESMTEESIPLLLRDKKRVSYPNRMEFEQFLRFLSSR